MGQTACPLDVGSHVNRQADYAYRTITHGSTSLTMTYRTWHEVWCDGPNGFVLDRTLSELIRFADSKGGK
jgi:hypothetical protein